MHLKRKQHDPSDQITVEEERPNPIQWIRIQEERPSILYTFALFAVFLIFHHALKSKEELDDPEINPRISITDTPGDAQQKLDKICKDVLTNYERLCSPKGEPFNFNCVVKHALGEDGQVSEPSEFVAVVCARHKMVDSLAVP